MLEPGAEAEGRNYIYGGGTCAVNTFASEHSGVTVAQKPRVQAVQGTGARAPDSPKRDDTCVIKKHVK